MKIAYIAASFVELALKHKHNWMNIKELPASDVQVLFETISAAGFSPKAVVPGKLKGRYLEQDGTRTGETYPINSLCPFKVINEEGDNNYCATGWLNHILSHVVSGRAEDDKSRKRLIGEIRSEIKRSVPLEPIQLTPEGDMLKEYPPSTGSNYFVDHTRDRHELSSCVGLHVYCNGWIDRIRAAKTHDAIVCRNCHLRVLFPKEVKTYGELRQALASKHIPVPMCHREA